MANMISNFILIKILATSIQVLENNFLNNNLNLCSICNFLIKKNNSSVITAYNYKQTC